MISFIFLYLHDHSQLQEYRNQATEKTLNINHRERLEKRSARVRYTCNEFNHVLFKIIFFMVATSFVFCLAILAAFLMLKMIVWIRNSLEVSLAPGR